MQAGALRHRLTIQRPVETRTDSGAVAVVFEDWLEVWGAVEPLTGREFYAAQQVQADQQTRVRIRHRPGITPKMRIRHVTAAGSPTLADLYDIEAVLDVAGRGRELHLMCHRRDAEGFRTGAP